MKRLAAALMAAVPVAAMAGVVARSPAPRIELGGKPVTVSLQPQATHAARCFVTVEGMTALHPAGTSYDIAVATPGNPPVSVGTLSFYEAVSLQPSASTPQSFEVPKAYCAAKSVVVTIRPLGAANPAAKAALGRISLVSQR